jgi:serine/threonine-protein kinase
VWLSDDRIPKVAGFGMAKGFAAMAWDDRCRSPLAYLAPEQLPVPGRRLSVGDSSGNSRADQFSLAVIAYEMLEGQHPFIDKKEGGNAYAIPYSRRWGALCQQPPVPLDEVFPSLPESLLLPLGRALHPDPPQRFATCAEFVATLGQPSARGKGGFRKIEDPDRRRGQGIAGFLRTVFRTNAQK